MVNIASTGNDKATVNRGSASAIQYGFFEDNVGVWVFYSVTGANTFYVTDVCCIHKDYAENDEKLFQTLKKQWHKERGSTSSTTKIVSVFHITKSLAWGKGLFHSFWGTCDATPITQTIGFGLLK